MSEPDQRDARPSYSVLLTRSSADPVAMVAFLQTLGLRSVQHDDSGGAEFAGRAGLVAVRAAAAAEPGTTVLDFAVTEVSAAERALAGAGLRVETWDAGDGGRAGRVVLPGGLVLGLDQETAQERFGDLPVHEQKVAASLDVVAVRPSSDFATDASVLANFGFEPVGGLDDPWWCPLRAGRTSGVIGLHSPGDEPVPTAPDASPVRLGFETSEPLDALAGRLRAAGHDATVETGEGGAKVVVTDPDGQQVEIHPTS
ncbi:MAG TPA: VOC family protein [Microlunatus sp.]|nr:VOC family protein [Microlunatus sp.]